MHLDHTPEQQRSRTEPRAYFAELVPDNAYARYTDPAAQKRFYRDTIRQLGSARTAGSASAGPRSTAGAG